MGEEDGTHAMVAGVGGEGGRHAGAEALAAGGGESADAADLRGAVGRMVVARGERGAVGDEGGDERLAAGAARRAGRGALVGERRPGEGEYGGEGGIVGVHPRIVTPSGRGCLDAPTQ